MSENLNSAPYLLAIVEMGGYPNFTPLYRELGFQVEMVPTVRKAQAWLKSHKPAAVVTEFVFDPELRDRMGNLESLFATLQRYGADAKVIVLHHQEHLPRLERAGERYPIFEKIAFPIDKELLRNSLERATKLT